MAQFDPIAVKTGIPSVLGTDAARADKIGVAGLTTAALVTGDACQVTAALTMSKASNLLTSAVVGVYDGTSGSVVRAGVVVATMAAGVVLANGDTVYLSTTAGALTNVKPYFSNLHEVGVVVSAAASKVLLQPKPVVVLPDFHIWTANYTPAASVSKLWPDWTKIKDYATPIKNYACCYDGAGSIWAVTQQNSPNHKVYKIDKNTGVVTLTLTPTYSGISSPSGVCTDGTYIYVTIRTGAGNGALKQYALDGTAGWTTAIGNNPYGPCYDPITGSIWSAANVSNDVTKVRISDGVNLGAYALGGTGFRTCCDRRGAVWATVLNTNSVRKFSVADGSVVGTYAVGTLPTGIATDGTYVYVSNGSTSNVTKLLVADGSAVTLVTEAGQEFLCLDGNGYMWIVVDPDQVAKRRISDGALIGRYTVATGNLDICNDLFTI